MIAPVVLEYTKKYFKLKHQMPSEYKIRIIVGIAQWLHSSAMPLKDMK